MRWRRRDGPWGSHQLDASALKWETSVGSTVELEVGLWCFEGVEDMGRDPDIVGIPSAGCLAGDGRCDDCKTQLRIERTALLELCSRMVSADVWWGVRVALGSFGTTLMSPNYFLRGPFSMTRSSTLFIYHTSFQRSTSPPLLTYLSFRLNSIDKLRICRRPSNTVLLFPNADIRTCSTSRFPSHFQRQYSRA
jgi:hypothetical protein